MEPQKDPARKLLSTLFTTIDAEEFIARMDAFLSNIYTIERKDILSVIDETLPENISKEIKDYLYITNTSLTHQEEVRMALTKLQQAIRAARILSLTLAYSPSKKVLTNICQTIKNEFGQDVIVELNTNADLIAGAVIVFEGKYSDQSAKKKLDILFEVKRDEILKFLA